MLSISEDLEGEDDIALHDTDDDILLGDSSDAYCNSDGTNCEEERGENIYAEVPDPKPLEDIGTPGEDVAIPVEETPKKKSERTTEKNSKADNAEHKGKKDSASSPEELEEELRAAYKSTQKKTKVKTSDPVNLEGCQKLLDQAQVKSFH